MKATISPLHLVLLLATLSVAPRAWSQLDQWAWFKGAHTPNTQSQFGSNTSIPSRPSARNAWGATWQTADGLIWMFGGYGIDALGKTGALNDLWNFDPATKQWTWVGGDSLADQVSHYGIRGVPSKNNKPGGRYGSASGTGADGQFYLYSGYGSHASSPRGGFLNDVWRFNPKEKTWTWIGGDTLINQRGVWGTRGVAAPGNKPDARYQGAGYVDGKNFYVFGGKGGGRGPECYSCLYNDLWKYDIDANLWTWLGGDDDRNQQGSYGQKGVEDPQNKPGARDGVVMSVYQGRIYIFGGLGINNGDAQRFNDLWRFNPASSQWAWISGDRKGNERGLYGPKGVSNAASHPGARDGASAGFDQKGNFYVFGGTGFDKTGKLSQLNDLWTYELSSDKWTWLSGDDRIRALGTYGTQGVPSQTNTPGARCYAAHWLDKKDNFWLYGGILQGYEGSARAQFSDLWMFNMNTKAWTWVSGEKKVNDAGSYARNNGIGSMELGARSNGVRWTDKSGNLWFFGGLGPSHVGRPSETGRYGDLWKYDIVSNSWSFVKGDMVPHTFGFGAKGQASGENRPRSRDGAVSWVDNEGDLWLFGGRGAFINPAKANMPDLGQLNDLWEYNIRSNQWVWVGGDTAGNNKGTYGAPGTASRSNMPGSRTEAAGWTDPQGNFWLFGGLGYDAAGSKESLLNDLWKFNPGTKEWTWVSGNNVSDQPSVYGERAVPSSLGHPGSRHQVMYWSDGNSLWLFGGYGIDAAQNPGKLNDLWRYDINANRWTWLGGNTIRNSVGQYGSKGKALPGNWPSSRTTGATWFDGHDLWLFGGNSGYTQAQDASEQLNDLWRYNPQTAYWTWVGGDTTTNSGSQFGTRGSFAPGNMPGSRAGTTTWTTSGRFWMFGGTSYHATGSIHDRNNELWAFVPSPCSGLSANISPLLDSVYCPTESVKLTASGGSSYQWLLNDTVIAGATAAVYQAKKAGVYQAIVYSGTSCHAMTRKATVHVTGWKSNIKSSISPAAAILCEDQVVTLRVQYDKTGPKPTFQWFKNGVQVPGITADTLVVQEAATYTVRESYCSGPFEAVPGTTEISDALTTSFAVLDASCGQSNGSVALTVSKGKAPYTFNWTGPDNFRSTKEDLDGLAAGTYKVEVKDAAGCLATLNAEVKSALSTISATSAITDASCAQDNGAIALSVTGGTAPYTFTWMGPDDFSSTQKDIDEIAAGAYKVVVKDATGCTVTLNPEVKEGSSNLTATAVTTGTLCGEANGSVKINATGGKSPYSYRINNGAFDSNTEVTGLSAGTYIVTVKDDAGCAFELEFTIASANSDLSATDVVTDASCGGKNGSIALTVTGGKNPYTFTWTGPSDFSSTKEDVDALPAGTYKVEIRDATGCTITLNPEIKQGSSTLTATAATTGASCGQANGVASITVSGGNAPYTFVWTGPGSFNASGKDIDSLAAGTYQVVVRDALGCTETVSAEVKGAASTLKATAVPASAACGQTNGSVRINASGGIGPYSYRIDDGAFKSLSEFKNLSTGSYTATIRDAVNCTVEVTFTIRSSNSDLHAIATVTNASCGQKEGAVVLKVTGGKAPYTFSWTGPDGFTASSKDLRNLPAGVYTAEVQDAVGCQYTLKTEVKQSASTLSATAAATPATCGNTSGIVQINASGGKAPYSYSLDNGAFGTASRFSEVSPGSHKVVVKDGGSCRFEVVFTIDGDNKLPKVVINDPAPLCTNATADLTAAAVSAGSDAGLQFTYWKDTAARTPLSNPAAASAGTYYIKGVGQNGCAVTKPVHVSINTTPVGTITPASASVCTGGSTLLAASTGTAYQWYYNGSIIDGATGATYSAAKAGNYNVFISDGACLERASNTVAVSISAVDTSVRIMGSATVCEGTVQLKAGTGAAYQWYRNGFKLEGATTDLYTASSSGKYTVSVTNQQGCRASSREVIITVLQKPTADFTVSASCAGEPVSFINLSAVANSGAVTHLWNFASGQNSVQRSPNYTYREPGTYKVSLTVTPNACPQNVQTVTKTLEVKETVPGTTYGPVNAVANVPFALEARAFGIEYNWTPAAGLNNSRIQSPRVNISSDQTYIIEIKNGSGCITRDTVQVKVQHSKVNAYVPTAFTPNGNGQNDKLRPVLFNIPKLTSFKVFNRWGQLVFQTSQMGEGWDGTLKGKEQPSESYRWILECVDANGKTIKRSGTSLLIK